MKKMLFIFIIFTALIASAQNLNGIKICLDPGHGFESWINHYVVPQLRIFLQNAGASVITTRADYDSTGSCITLTQRKAIANNANVNFFHSVHHNAFLGTSNYTLALFKQLNANDCPSGNPAWPGQADLMANILIGTKLLSSSEQC